MDGAAGIDPFAAPSPDRSTRGAGATVAKLALHGPSPIRGLADIRPPCLALRARRDPDSIRLPWARRGRMRATHTRRSSRFRYAGVHPGRTPAGAADDPCMPNAVDVCLRRIRQLPAASPQVVRPCDRVTPLVSVRPGMEHGAQAEDRVRAPAGPLTRTGERACVARYCSAGSPVPGAAWRDRRRLITPVRRIPPAAIPRCVRPHRARW